MEDQNSQLEFREAQKEFEREVAIVTARPIIYKAVILLWIIFDVFLLGILIFVTVGYLAFGQFSDRTSTAGLVKNLFTIHESAVGRSADSLFIQKPAVVHSGNAYDFTAWITNDNTDWYAQFDYYFSSSVGDTGVSHGFIFPEESRPLTSLRQEFENEPKNVELVVDNLEWTRLDAHLVGDLNTWYSQRNNFTFDNVAHGTVLVGGKSVVSSSFTVLNNTPYSYWSAPFVLLLQRNGVIVGINQFSIAGFESGESRPIQVNWFDSTVSSGDLLIIPMIDYMDEDAYMPADAQVDVDVRD